jgi:hypothetical protein
VRVRALMDVLSDEALRDCLRRLGGAMVRASRLSAIADDKLRAANRRELGGRLQHYRGSLALSAGELREADALAAKLAALDELAARRLALDEECDGLEARVDALRDGIFEARRNPAMTPAVTRKQWRFWRGWTSSEEVSVQRMRKRNDCSSEGLRRGGSPPAVANPRVECLRNLPARTEGRRFGRFEKRVLLPRRGEGNQCSGGVFGAGRLVTSGSLLQRATSRSCAASNAEKRSTQAFARQPRRTLTAGAPVGDPGDPSSPSSS